MELDDKCIKFNEYSLKFRNRSIRLINILDSDKNTIVKVNVQDLYFSLKELLCSGNYESDEKVYIEGIIFDHELKVVKEFSKYEGNLPIVSSLDSYNSWFKTTNLIVGKEHIPFTVGKEYTKQKKDKLISYRDYIFDFEVIIRTTKNDQIRREGVISHKHCKFTHVEEISKCNTSLGDKIEKLIDIYGKNKFPKDIKFKPYMTYDSLMTVKHMLHNKKFYENYQQLIRAEKINYYLKDEHEEN